MHLTPLGALALCLLMSLALGGCFVEVDERGCFGGGPERLDDNTGTTEVCCDPQEPTSNAEICRPFFRGGVFAQVEDLSVCTPEGRCALDCQAGFNCECLRGADCGGFGCKVIADPVICAHHGQLGEVRCSICNDCRTKGDCEVSEHPLGAQCVIQDDGLSGHCGCRTDDDCTLPEHLGRRCIIPAGGTSGHCGCQEGGDCDGDGLCTEGLCQ